MHVKISLLLYLLLVFALQASAQTSLVPFGSEWKYLDNGSNQGTAWRATTFSDATWKTGNGKFGYGISDATTVISYGPNAKRKYITTYFRKAITLADKAAYSSYTAKVKRDDGVVVYVNGVEVYRNNMPTGTIAYTTLASASSGGDDGATPIPFTIPATAFTSGTNVIAVEVHQQRANSSDLAFDLELVGNPVNQPPTVSISSPAEGAGFTMGQTIDIAAIANDPEGALTEVEFFANSVSLGKDNTSSYSISWTPTTTGTYTLTAKATDGAGAATTSTGVNVTITVAPPMDQTPPVVISINRQNPASDTTSAVSVIFRTTFSEKVTGVEAVDFTATTVSGTVTGTVAAVDTVGTTGSVYDVTVISVSGTGILRLDLRNSGTGITDTSNNAIIGGYTTGQTYTIEPTSVQQVVSFTLVNANNEQDMQSIPDGATLNLATISSVKLNIRANTSPASVGSVKFELSGTQSRTYTDNRAPYALWGDDGLGNYYYGTWYPPATGTYTLKATPYTAPNATGTAGTPRSITFTFVNQTEPPIDQTPPTVISINRQSPTTETNTATSVIFRTTFSEKVTGVDATDFIIATTGSVNGIVAQVVAVGTTGITYDVTVGSITGEGTLRLDLRSSGTGIVDVAGNAIQAGYTNGQSYIIGQTPEPPSTTTLVSFQSSWKYLDNGTNQDTGWRSTTFDDASWKTGNGKFGYGITDATTVVSYGPNASNKYITTYFRKSITIADASVYTSYIANVKRDDGVVVYVNGVEVYRNNMPTGTIAYTTLASASSGGDDGATPIPFTIPATAFTSGTNEVAVEIHQYSVSSSDIAFDLEVVGKTGSNAALLTRGPYLQMGSQSAVTLRWRTDIATDSKIEVGITPGNYTLSATNSSITTEHEVRITGLAPNTKYYYRFGSSSQALQSGSSNYFKTAPTQNSTGKIRVAFFGDTGTDPEDVAIQTNTLNAYLNYTGSNPAELLLLTGDLAEPNGTDEDYQKKFFSFYGQSLLKNHIVFTSPGNHEYGQTVRTSRTGPYFGNFTMPTAGESGGVASGTEAYYSFDWGNIHFISLDSYGIEQIDNTRVYDTTGVQVKWLKQDLEANNKKWVIVYFHHPPYTMGTHNSDTESDLIRIRQNLAPILDRYGVDLVVSGHSHNYERSYLLNRYYGNEASFNVTTYTKSSSSAKYNGSTNSCPYVTTSGAKNHGTVYVVAGSSGAIGTVQASHPHNALPFAVNDGGMLYLEVEDNQLNGKMLRKDGTVFDQFTIMQDVNRTTNLTTAPGNTEVLTASWTGTYRWSTGEATRSITVSPASNTTYEVTDEYGCLTDIFNVITETASTTNQSSILNGLNQLKVYPTLAKQGTLITVEMAGQEAIEAFVTDIAGRVVYTKSKVTGTFSIETADLPAGMYIINLLGEKGLSKQKFMVTD